MNTDVGARERLGMRAGSRAKTLLSAPVSTYPELTDHGNTASVVTAGRCGCCGAYCNMLLMMLSVSRRYLGLDLSPPPLVSSRLFASIDFFFCFNCLQPLKNGHLTHFLILFFSMFCCCCSFSSLKRFISLH